MLGGIGLLRLRSRSSRVMFLLLGVTVAASLALGLLTWRLTVLNNAVRQQLCIPEITSDVNQLGYRVSSVVKKLDGILPCLEIQPR